MQSSNPNEASTSTQYDAGLLGHWLHALLVAFYTDEEAVMVDFLFQRAAMVRGITIAKAVGLPERQVRLVLERRLIPDCLVERVAEENSLGRGQNYYRLSPLAVAIGAKRLQSLEDTLARASSQSEGFKCPACDRCYDSFEAMTSKFVCGDCNKEMVCVENNAAIRRGRLQRFRTQCQELLHLTRKIKDAPMPQFGKDPQEGAQNAAQQATSQEGATPDAPTEKSAVAHNASLDAATVATKDTEWFKTALDTEWFQTEVLGSGPFMGLGAGCASPDAHPPDEFQRAMADAKQRLQQEGAQRKRQLEEELHQRESVAVKRARVEPDIVLFVEGKRYSFDQVCKDGTLLERMTDDEYERFFAAEREREIRDVSAHFGLNVKRIPAPVGSVQAKIRRDRPLVRTSRR